MPTTTHRPAAATPAAPPAARRPAQKRPAAKRPAATAQTRPAPAPSLAARKARRGLALPGWADLDSSGITAHAGREAAGQRKAAQLADRKAGRPAARLRPFDVVPSLRFGLLVLIACAVGTLFVAHVYATRDTLADLQAARSENVRLRMTGQRLRGEFDHLTGPEAVMPRAAAVGLVEGVAYGVPIRLEEGGKRE